jgi:hypothetical protein
MERNPLIEPEDFFSGYNKSIQDHKNNPKVIEFDKLCYELFEHQEVGRHFMKLIEERYLIPSMVSKGNPTYQIDVLWQEGFKDAFRLIRTSVMSHQQRILAETK